jgi:electron transfer flavoprotein alpha subunit
MIVAASWEAGGLGRAASELLGAAGELAGALGTEVAFVALGEAAAAEAAGAHGARRAFVVEGAGAATGAETLTAALAELAREVGARAVLLAADDVGAEVGPRLAERLGGAAVTHAVGLEATDGRIVATRPVFGGKAVARVAATAEPVVATLRRGAFAAATAIGGAAAVETRRAPAVGGAVELVGTEPVAAGASLEDASVIVSGGAGLGSGESFAELQELASLLGGAVGASLAAVDAGWASPEQQVGLTGKTVSPNVYFAFGISGASQHLAGIGGAKAVVAVNTDPDAPIFDTARLGVVMDCRRFLAALIAQLRNGARSAA